MKYFLALIFLCQLSLAQLIGQDMKTSAPKTPGSYPSRDHRACTRISFEGLQSLSITALISAKIYRIKKGTRVCLIERNGEIILKPVTPEYLDKMAGILGKEGKPLEALRKEKEREQEL